MSIILHCSICCVSRSADDLADGLGGRLDKPLHAKAGLFFSFAGESLAEPERHHGGGVEVAARGIVGDELAYRVRQFLRFDIDWQAKILSDLRARRTADRFNGVVDAVSGTFYISR